MDIYTATSAAQRILKFADESLEAKAAKYSSSVKRYELLVELLKEATDKLQQCLPTASNTFRRNNAGSVLPILSPVDDTAEEVKQHSKQRVIESYAAVITKLASKSSGYYEIDQFISVLRSWYQTRFVSCGSMSDFQCNTKYLGKWLLQLTVCYGNALENGSAEQFLSYITEFTYSLENGFLQSRYILPAEIYNLMKELSGNTTSLTGAVIWDMLYDLGLNCLDPRYSVSYLDKDAAQKLYDQRSDDVPHYYHRYTVSDRVLSRTKLTPYLQGGDDEC